MKKLGNYTAFGKGISGMSARGKKATKRDFLDSIPLLFGVGAAFYFYLRSRNKKPIAYDPTKNNVVVSK
jgi:hypothetical protein